MELTCAIILKRPRYFSESFFENQIVQLYLDLMKTFFEVW